MICRTALLPRKYSECLLCTDSWGFLAHSRNYVYPLPLTFIVLDSANANTINHKAISAVLQITLIVSIFSPSVFNKRHAKKYIRIPSLITALVGISLHCVYPFTRR